MKSRSIQQKTVVAPSMQDQPLHLQVLAYVQNSPGATYQELAVNFQATLPRVRRAIRELKVGRLVTVTHANGRAQVAAKHPAVYHAQDHDPLTIHAADLFCGVGGFSQGFAQALQARGRDLRVHVDLVGVNHDEQAIQGWEANHSWGRSCREDITKAQPRKLFPGGRLNLLLASPSCTHFSTARGGLPVSDQLRTHAWMVVRWARDLDVDTIIVENVPEFRSWGPTRLEPCACTKTGPAAATCRYCKGGGIVEVPIKDGSIFRKWIRELKLLGYTFNYDEDGQPGQVLNAADYGDATGRRRFFLIAKKGTGPVPVPKQTHSKGGKVPGTQAWRCARDVIDFTLPSKSIFDRKKPLAKKTLRRMFDGLERRNGDWIKPFLGALRQEHGIPVTAPRKGRKGKRPEAVIVGQHGGGVPRGTDEPLATIATGGAIAVASPELIALRNHLRGDLDAPAPTLTAGGQHLGVAQPSIVQLTHGGRTHDPDAPLPTITPANRGELGLAEANLQPVVLPPDGPGGNGENNVAASVDSPLNAIRASRGDRFGLANPVLTQYNGNGDAPSLEAPLPTQSTRDRFGVAEPCLVDCLGSKDNYAARTKGVDEPVRATTRALCAPGLRKPSS